MAKKQVKKTAVKVIKKAIKKIQIKTKKFAVKTTVKKITDKKSNNKKFVAHKTSLKIGDKAPNFEGLDQHGNTLNLKSFVGKKIIIYFYPKDDTPGCTATACSLRDEHTFLNKNNFVVIGVSADDQKSHLKFANKYELPFSLIADVNKSILKAYQVWGTKQFMGKIYDGIIRTTFIINEKGIISNIISDVNTSSHAQQILAS